MLSLAFALSTTTFTPPEPVLIDPKATAQTRALFANLKKIGKTGVLFGHQNATEYGHGWSGDEDRSDIKSVVGSHPAVIGVDFNGIAIPRDSKSGGAQATKLRKAIVDHYDRGGAIAACCHLGNPVTGGNFNFKKGEGNTVKHLLPGGSHHDQFKAILANIATFAKSCRGKDGKLVPIIFRPWHEFDGDWFWWGRGHCTIEEFTALYKLTVSELRDANGVHNLIYAFSPDCKFNTETEFLERYPGDAWVDLVGFDDYADFGRDRYDLTAGLKKLMIVSDLAKKRGKVAAFTETGLESIPNPTWYTETLLKTLKTPGLELAFVMVWRNDQRSPTHYYAPFPGHLSVPDFQKFYDDPFTLFQKDLKSLYGDSGALLRP